MKNQIIKKVIGISIVLLSMIASITSSYASSEFKSLKFELDSLDNGLKVIYHVDRTAPVVATVVHYQVGSRDEDPSQTGYAHFFEHLMFEATNNIPRASIDKYVQEAGGNLNASTSFDQTVYHFRLPANEIKLALWIESQRMRQLKVDEVGVETQRGVVLEEIKQRASNQQYGTMLDKMCNNLFAGTGYGWFVLGYEEHVSRATIEDFQKFYNNFYQPINATLVISGDIDINETKQMVKDYFGSIPPAPEPKRRPFVLTEMTKGYNETIVDDKAQLPAIFVGYRGPSMKDKDYFATTLLTDILAAGESSRLYQRLVSKDQIAVQSSLFPISLEYSGMILLIGVVSPGKKTEQVEKAMFDEINNIVKNGVTDEELQKAKNIREARFINSKKMVLEKAQDFARYYSYFGDASLINTEIDMFLSVTKEDIIAAAQKYLNTDKRVILTYVPQGYNK